MASDSRPSRPGRLTKGSNSADPSNQCLQAGNDLTGLLRTVGVELTKLQQSTVRARIAATSAATTAHARSSLSFDVWLSEKPPPRNLVYGP